MQACGHSLSHQLTDADVRHSVRHLLGLPATTKARMPDKCTCGVAIAGNTYHGMHCRLTRRTVVTRGHDRISQLLTMHARQAGATARMEPTDLTWKNNQHPDGEIIMGDDVTWFDVTIRDPGAPSHVVAAGTKLAIAKSAEKSTRNIYADMARVSKVAFMPFAYEATGAAGPSAQMLLDKIVDWCKDNQPLVSAPALRISLVYSIAVAIQRRNAAATRICLELSRVRELDETRRVLTNSALNTREW